MYPPDWPDDGVKVPEVRRFRRKRRRDRRRRRIAVRLFTLLIRVVAFAAFVLALIWLWTRLVS